MRRAAGLWLPVKPDANAVSGVLLEPGGCLRGSLSGAVSEERKGEVQMNIAIYNKTSGILMNSRGWKTGQILGSSLYVVIIRLIQIVK